MYYCIYGLLHIWIFHYRCITVTWILNYVIKVTNVTWMLVTLGICYIFVTLLYMWMYYCIYGLLHIWIFHYCYITVTWMLNYVIMVTNVTWMHVTLGLCFILWNKEEMDRVDFFIFGKKSLLVSLSHLRGCLSLPIPVITKEKRIKSTKSIIYIYTYIGVQRIRHSHFRMDDTT